MIFLPFVEKNKMNNKDVARMVSTLSAPRDEHGWQGAIFALYTQLHQCDEQVYTSNQGKFSGQPVGKVSKK